MKSWRQAFKRKKSRNS